MVDELEHVYVCTLRHNLLVRLDLTMGVPQPIVHIFLRGHLYTRIILEIPRMMPIPQIHRFVMPIIPLRARNLFSGFIHMFVNVLPILDNLNGETGGGVEGDVAVHDPYSWIVRLEGNN